jgi:hypothetical protein
MISLLNLLTERLRSIPNQSISQGSETDAFGDADGAEGDAFAAGIAGSNTTGVP